MSPNERAISNARREQEDCYKQTMQSVQPPKEALPDKQFEDRRSIITELLENKNFRTIHHIVLAFFLSLCISTVLQNRLYQDANGIEFLYYKFFKAFQNLHFGILSWLCIFLQSVLSYYIVKLWAWMRQSLKGNPLQIYLLDRCSLICYITHLLAMLYSGAVLIRKCDMGFIVSAIIILDTVRLVMKAYAFGRVYISSIRIQGKKQYPQLSHYIYFSFAPTLVYRDSYPRSSGNVKWRNIAIYFLEIGISISFLITITEKVYITQLQDYGSKHIPTTKILLLVFDNALLGLLFLFVLGYFILHLSLNAFSEMLQFSDRLFYRDWWTSTSYQRYFRTWNIAVNDWLYEYVYKDLNAIVSPTLKIVPKLFILLLSALVHDYIFFAVFGYYTPIFLIAIFFLGQLALFLVKFPNNFVGNVLFLYTLGLGCSIGITITCLEFYARKNCFDGNVTMTDSFVFKLFECYK